MKNIIFDENAFENIICERAAYVSPPQYINIHDKVLGHTRGH